MLSALKNFGVTFLISALLFGVIAYFATLFVSSTVNSILDDESNELNDIMSQLDEPAEEEPAEDEERASTEELETRSANLLKERKNIVAAWDSSSRMTFRHA